MERNTWICGRKQFLPIRCWLWRFHDILLEQDTYDKLCGEENGTLGDPDSPLVEPLESGEQEDADDIDVEKNPFERDSS